MKQYKYILEPYKGKGTRYACPDCLEKDQFTKYIDIETNEYVNDIVGRCNREDKCGYHYSPREYFLNNDFKDGQPDQKRKKSKSKLMSKTDSVPSFIDFDNPSEIFATSLEIFLVTNSNPRSGDS